MADRVFMPRALDDSGAVVSGAIAYFFETGTTTPLTVYSDSDGLTPLGTSAEADATGVFPAVFTVEPLRIDIRTGLGVSLTGFPSDTWYVTPSVGVGASTVTFSPIEGNAATNVQAAILNLTTLWNAVTTFGRSLIASTTASAARTTLELGGLATLEVIDEDDMVTNSATRPPSQQSTKAYVDASVAAGPQIIASGRVEYTAGTPALVGDYGIASIADTATGIAELTFDTARADLTKLQFQLTANTNSGDPRKYVNEDPDNRTTAKFRVRYEDVNGNAEDGDYSFTVIETP